MLIVGDETPEEWMPKMLSTDFNTHNIIVYQREISKEEIKVEEDVRAQIDE